MAVGRTVIEIDIDATECHETIERMRSAMTPEQFERAMYGIMREVSKRVKRTLGNVVPQDYNVKAAEVRAAVMNGRLTSFRSRVHVSTSAAPGAVSQRTAKRYTGMRLITLRRIRSARWSTVASGRRCQ